MRTLWQCDGPVHWTKLHTIFLPGETVLGWFYSHEDAVRWICENTEGDADARVTRVVCHPEFFNYAVSV